MFIFYGLVQEAFNEGFTSSIGTITWLKSLRVLSSYFFDSRLVYILHLFEATVNFLHRCCCGYWLLCVDDWVTSQCRQVPPAQCWTQWRNQDMHVVQIHPAKRCLQGIQHSHTTIILSALSGWNVALTMCTRKDGLCIVAIENVIQHSSAQLKNNNTVL